MSQNKRLEALLKRRWLTQLQAYDAIQCTRLEVKDLRAALTYMTAGSRPTQVSGSKPTESLSPGGWRMPWLTASLRMPDGGMAQAIQLHH